MTCSQRSRRLVFLTHDAADNHHDRGNDHKGREEVDLVQEQQTDAQPAEHAEEYEYPKDNHAHVRTGWFRPAGPTSPPRPRLVIAVNIKRATTGPGLVIVVRVQWSGSSRPVIVRFSAVSRPAPGRPVVVVVGRRRPAAAPRRAVLRSEERRVGKEGRCAGWPREWKQRE